MVNIFGDMPSRASGRINSIIRRLACCCMRLLNIYLLYRMGLLIVYRPCLRVLVSINVVRLCSSIIDLFRLNCYQFCYQW